MQKGHNHITLQIYIENNVVGRIKSSDIELITLLKSNICPVLIKANGFAICYPAILSGLIERMI